MAHFSSVKPGGTWASLDVPGAAAFTTFDTNLAKAINGDDGGVWAPSAAIEIGGESIEFSAEPKLANDVAIQGLDSGGTAVNLAKVDSSDVVTIGDATSDDLGVLAGEDILFYPGASAAPALTLTSGGTVIEGGAHVDNVSVYSVATGDTLALDFSDNVVLVRVTTGSGDATITPPAAPTNGHRITVKVYSVEVSGAGVEFPIYPSGNATISVDQAVTFVYSSTLLGWVPISFYAY
jgi:hypothetical protein